MEVFKTKQLSESQFQQINELWNTEFPVQLNNRFSLLLEDVSNFNHYLIEDNKKVVAWAVSFEKENETRFSIIVDSHHQGKGLGKLLLDRLKFDLGEFYGWVIDHNNDLKQNGMGYKSPLSFYDNQGFEVLNERVEDGLLKAVKIKRIAKVYAETERFILREFLQTDVDGMFDLDSNPEVHRYLGNNPVTSKEQIVELINYIRTQYKEHGIGRWAIIDKKTNEFVGWSGLKFVTETTNYRQNFYDIGYRLRQKYWGQGIATETAKAALEYAFDVMKIDMLYAAADCNNLASNKILSNLGFRITETFYYTDIKCNWYEMNREEYGEMA